MRSVRLALTVLLLGLAGPAGVAPASTAAAPPSPALASLAAPAQDAVDQVVRDAMASQQIPGVSLAIVHRNRLVYLTGYGFAHGTSRTATAETVYRLASISKTFTAVAAMQLVERGAFDLDAPVQTYVAAFPVKRWPITSRQLLNHTSGIRHYKGREIYSTTRYVDLLKPLEIFRGDPLEHEPGTKFLYSSYAYNLLGAAIETAAQEPFVDYVRRRIFEPTGMTAARVDDAAVKIANLATGYDPGGAGSMLMTEAPAFDASNKIPAGGFVATAGDMAGFAVAVMTDRLMRRETRDVMWSRAEGSATPYGLGWVLGRWNGERTASHSGAQPGVSTMLWLAPERGCAVVFLTNKGRLTGLGDVARRLAAAGCAS